MEGSAVASALEPPRSAFGLRRYKPCGFGVIESRRYRRRAVTAVWRAVKEDRTRERETESAEITIRAGKRYIAVKTKFLATTGRDRGDTRRGDPVGPTGASQRNQMRVAGWINSNRRGPARHRHARSLRRCPRRAAEPNRLVTSWRLSPRLALVRDNHQSDATARTRALNCAEPV